MRGLEKGVYELDTSVVYDDKHIQQSVTDLANTLKVELDLTDSVYVCTMNGAVQFFHDITKQLPSGICQYVKASSYIDNARTDRVNITLLSNEPVAYSRGVNRIIIFDDICDTGNTLDALVRFYHRNHPTADIHTVVLIHRNRPDAVYRPNFSAIQTDSSAWFAGYGLDNMGYDRNLPYIYEIPHNLK